MSKEKELHDNITRLDSIRNKFNKKIRKLEKSTKLNQELRDKKLLELVNDVASLSYILDKLSNTKRMVNNIRAILHNPLCKYGVLRERYVSNFSNYVTYEINQEILDSKMCLLYYNKVTSRFDNNVGYIAIGVQYVNGEHAFVEYYPEEDYKSAIDAYVERFLGNFENLSSTGSIHKLEDFLTTKV